MPTNASQRVYFNPLPNAQHSLRAWARAALLGAVMFAGLLQLEAATRFVSLSGTHVPPFETWDQAATNIQAAIDIAVAGDEVLVTNGVYATGGKVVVEDLTNRIVINKAITVRSVNGARVTEIRGSGGINGPEAVRCAWLKNGAVVSGFTLSGGATRASGNVDNLFGGGIWCEGNGALIADCFVTSNSADSRGAGAYRGSLLRCRIFRNNCIGTGSEGGGIYMGIANNSEIFENSAKGWGGGLSRSPATNCAIYRNLSYSNGGGAYSSTLTYCTVTANTGINPGGGVYSCAAINCIIYGNARDNYSAGTFRFTCSEPLPGGPGNIGSDPRVLSDLFHIAKDSPCRGAGTNISAITGDIEGHARQNPPTMGCEEWRPEPMASIDPTPKVSTSPLRLRLVSAIAGEEPMASYWLKSGQPIVDEPRYGIVPGQELVITNLVSEDKGDYQLVASNAFGVFTSAVLRVDFHCVDASNPNPRYPYLTWETASANIQDAVDAAANGALIVVTNGIYSSGGRVAIDGLTNRVVVARPVVIASVNGPGATFIQGARDPASTIGPAAVRGLWLADGARIGGFTIEGGSTDDTYKAHGQGGGVLGNSTNAVVIDCVLRNNWAHNGGGGASVTFDRCKLIENAATENGGGAQGAVVVNSIVRSNVAVLFGGGGMSCRWFNSTIVENVANSGGGIHASRATNCIIYYNRL